MSRVFRLDPQEISHITGMVKLLGDSYSSVESVEFLSGITLHAHDLPRRLREFLNEFRLADADSDFALISGFPIDGEAIGPTPVHWDHRPPVSPTLKEEIYAMLLGALVAILSGRRDAPYICVDPVFMASPGDPKAVGAFNALRKALDQNLNDVSLSPGDVVFVDNARVIHGRQPFSPRYDGTDRWLKRFNLTRGLRKSFPVRGSESRRLVF